MFAGRAFRQGFICLGVFPCAVVFSSMVRKGVRWGKAGYNYFDGRCLAPVLEVSPCLSSMSISRTAGQKPLEEGSIPFPAGAKQLF